MGSHGDGCVRAWGDGRMEGSAGGFGGVIGGRSRGGRWGGAFGVWGRRHVGEGGRSSGAFLLMGDEEMTGSLLVSFFVFG